MEQSRTVGTRRPETVQSPDDRCSGTTSGRQVTWMLTTRLWAALCWSLSQDWVTPPARTSSQPDSNEYLDRVHSTSLTTSTIALSTWTRLQKHVHWWFTHRHWYEPTFIPKMHESARNIVCFWWNRFFGLQFCCREYRTSVQPVWYSWLPEQQTRWHNAQNGH